MCLAMGRMDARKNGEPDALRRRTHLPALRYASRARRAPVRGKILTESAPRPRAQLDAAPPQGDSASRSALPLQAYPWASQGRGLRSRIVTATGHYKYQYRDVLATARESSWI